EVWLQRRAKQLAKGRHIKSSGELHTAYRGLQRLWRPIDNPGERSPNRCGSPIPKDVLRHGTMRYSLESTPVQGSKQYTGITVAPVRFLSGWLRQPAHDRFHHSAGSVTATREPHRVVALVVSDIEEGLCARFVIAGEMSVRCEALRVENDLRRPVRIQRFRQRRHSLSNFWRHARSRRNHADPASLFAHASAQPALHRIGNPSRFRQCPNSEITFFVALAVVA